MKYEIRNNTRLRSAFVLCLLSCFLCLSSFAQNFVNDTEATALLQKVSEKYKAHKNITAEFKLLIQRPKINVSDDERKLNDTLNGKILLEGNKFYIEVRNLQIFCDGKNIWTYIPEDKEAQVNYYEESDDIFSPSKIFSLYKDGALYQTKEKKMVNGKNVTVIEMNPDNKKVSYFKIDVSIDNATLQLVESKIYQKNGTHYIYKLTKQTSDVPTNESTFTFDEKKYPKVKVVDLR